MAARPQLAVATSFAFGSVHDSSTHARGRQLDHCGFVKWCYSSTRLLELPAFGGRAETVLWTNAAGEQYVRAECGALAPRRFVRFRPPRLERSADGVTLSLPHIRLDRALQFLIGDRL